mmetsp:Transcript_12113/g.50975  ORF Transcript_12113/g.50975 Transcript_12113/m.50975 type:complete len:324 (-) Transcript_12113:2064-3035(-)
MRAPTLGHSLSHHGRALLYFLNRPRAILLRVLLLLRRQPGHSLRRVAHALERDLSVNLLNCLLQRAHAGIAAVVLHESVERVGLDAHIALAEAGGLPRSRFEVRLGDLNFLLFEVGAHLDDLHAVEEGLGDGVGGVGRGHEEHLAEIDRHVHIGVGKFRVLGGIEDLHERRRRIAAEAARADLVDLVQQDERVHRLGVREAVYHLAGHRTDVGTPVALQLVRVVKPTDGHACVGPPDRARNRAPNGGLADARRPHEQYDLALHRPTQAPHGDELEDAVLDVLEAVVILLEHLVRVDDVKVVVGKRAPRHLGQPVKIRAHHAVL